MAVKKLKPLKKPKPLVIKKRKPNSGSRPGPESEPVPANTLHEDDKILGPDYKYQDFIKTPSQLGITSRGTLKALSDDIVGITNYTDLLIYGDNAGAKKAITTGGALGNKFFYKSGGKCIDKITKLEKDRYFYVNNVQKTKSGLNGLMPGLIADLGVFGNISLMNAFTAPNKPDCQQITLQTISTNNRKGTESQYVALMDIDNMDPCLFPKGVNPVNREKVCRNGFTNIFSEDEISSETIFLVLFLLIGIYVLYKILAK